jgi:hypothetical protein
MRIDKQYLISLLVSKDLNSFFDSEKNIQLTIKFVISLHRFKRIFKWIQVSGFVTVRYQCLTLLPSLQRGHHVDFLIQIQYSPDVIPDPHLLNHFPI